VYSIEKHTMVQQMGILSECRVWLYMLAETTFSDGNLEKSRWCSEVTLAKDQGDLKVVPGLEPGTREFPTSFDMMSESHVLTTTLYNP
jgi:hypothetical protein